MPKAFLNFSITQTIGTGTFGKVKKAQHVPTSEYVAIKLLNKNKILSQKDSERVKRQIQILKSIDHPKIIKLYQLQQTAKSFYLITELVEGQQLFQKINRLGNLDQQMARSYFVQLLDAMLYLKSKGICHRDIKPQNIIVKGEQLKLIDFGLSNYFVQGQKLETSCGSPCYAAPQMMSQNSYDPLKTQIWALGITLYAMLTGKLPFQHSNTNKLYKIMQKNQYEEISGISGSLKSLLRAMIQVKPNLRITLEEIKDHIWIKSTKYNFQEKLMKQKWNQAVLQNMSIAFKQNIESLRHKISEQFGQASTFYHLSLKKSTLQSFSPYPIHQGPLHFAFVYPNIKLIKEEISKIMPHDKVWVSQSIVKSSKLKATIKKIPISQMFYLQIQNI